MPTLFQGLPLAAGRECLSRHSSGTARDLSVSPLGNFGQALARELEALGTWINFSPVFHTCGIFVFGVFRGAKAVLDGL